MKVRVQTCKMRFSYHKQKLRMVRVAVSQMSCQLAREENIVTAERLMRDAASKGAQIILLQELFAGHYFCQVLSSYYYCTNEFMFNKLLSSYAGAIK